MKEDILAGIPHSPDAALPPKVYVISLVRATERRRAISEQLARYGVEFEFVDAVDAKEVGSGFLRSQVDEVAVIHNIKRNMSDPEIACALSHRIVYRDIVDGGYLGGLILEDDAILPPCFIDAFGYFLRASRNLNEKKVVYNLEILSRPWASKLFLRRRTTFHVSDQLAFAEGIYWLSSQVWGSCGYYITKASAQNFVLSPLVETVGDDWLLWQRRTGGKLLFAIPPAVVHPRDLSDSQIEKSRRHMIDKGNSANKVSSDNLINWFYIAIRWRLIKIKELIIGRYFKSIAERLL